MDALRHVQALDRIKNPNAKAAFLYLLAMFERNGYETSPNSGQVYAVRVHDKAGRYVFSYIANMHDLLFYLRLPAFEAHADLKRAAGAAKFPFIQNAAGELTLRVDGQTTAKAVFAWLQEQIQA